MEPKFWLLSPHEDLSRLVEWDHDEMELEDITCTVDEMHRHRGKRLMDLHVVLPDRPVEDFVWTWTRDLLIQDQVLDLMREHGFTGFEVKPVTTRFRRSRKPTPRLWELVVTGWAGMAAPASGIRLNEAESCLTCGHLRYTGLLNPASLIDRRKYDGNDFFIVWPLPNYRFVTQRVVDTILAHHLTGCKIVPAEEIEPVPDGFSPGRLSYSMPEDRARELGEPLGIY